MHRAREKLFDIYSHNLEMVVEQANLSFEPPLPVYICPLCKRYFQRDAILSINGDSELTIEHVPPKSVGSKSTILTCKTCNNEHGSKLDSQLHRKLQWGKFLSRSPGKTMQAEFKVNDEILTRGHVGISESRDFEIFFDGRRTNLKHEEKLIKFVTSDTSKSSIEIKLTTHNRVLSNLSVLRSAYLLAFQKLGYAYIFSKGAEKVRQLIQSCEDIKNVPIVIEQEINDSLVGVNIVLYPESIRGFLVVLRIHEGDFAQNFSVFLPGANSNESTFFDNIETIHKQRELTCICMPIPDFDFVKDKRYVLTPVQMWWR